MQFIRGYNVSSIYVDPSAASFKAALLKKGIYTTDADNSIFDGIRFISSMLAWYEIYVDESCKNMIREFSLYMWNSKAQEKGIDEPISKDDHTLDALRYSCYSLFGKSGGGIIGGGNRR